MGGDKGCVREKGDDVNEGEIKEIGSNYGNTKE